MDLLTLSRAAIKHPLRPNNFFVLFVTTFIVLIIGFSVLYALSLLTQRRSSSQSLCDSSESEKVSGDVSSTSNEIYQLEFKGNERCFLSAAFTWKDPNDAAEVWVYNPEGKIEVVEASVNQTSTQFLKGSPIKAGLWRFVVKGKNSAAFKYSGRISVN
jgi:hypothetical protein